MDLSSKKTIKRLLLKYGAISSRGLGQNFLVSRPVLNKIAAAAELTKKDVVLEVGPGAGTLTKELAERAGEVIAVEKDSKMSEILRETLVSCKNVEVVQGDILKLSPKHYAPDAVIYKVVANIPYYITAPLIKKFLEAKNPPKSMVLMVQKEVAQRICANPPNMSLLAISAQFYAKPKIISYVKKDCFRPKPKVDSAILKITPACERKKTEKDRFFKVVKAGFSQPRKQLANNLAKSLKKNKKEVEFWLLKNGIKPAQRAETLSVDDWIRLANQVGAG